MTTLTEALCGAAAGTEVEVGDLIEIDKCLTPCFVARFVYPQRDTTPNIGTPVSTQRWLSSHVAQHFSGLDTAVSCTLRLAQVVSTS